MIIIKKISNLELGQLIKIDQNSVLVFPKINRSEQE